MIYKATEENIAKAGKILKNGGVVAIPTETVYGLAANALDKKAVAKIFAAKGRPADNPLIVHITDAKDIEKYAYPNEKAAALAKKFWPGPLTMILPKKECIPNIVSAGLDTVAIRCPSHPVARAIINAAEVPLAAPSANISGKPSATTAKHVLKDFGENIDAVIDGGTCDCGVESTVVTVATEPPVLLRPGFVTPEQLREILPDLKIAEAVTKELPAGAKVLSPGMKHKHYAPKAEAYAVLGSQERRRSLYSTVFQKINERRLYASTEKKKRSKTFPKYSPTVQRTTANGRRRNFSICSANLTTTALKKFISEREKHRVSDLRFTTGL